MSSETPNNESKPPNSQFGERFNSGKPPMHLLPWDALIELAKHYEAGARKYPARNWEQGFKWSEQTAASLMRHLAKWHQGEDIDPENGMPHDLAIAWNAIALVTFRLRGIGEDDRPRNPQPKKDEPNTTVH